MADEGRLAIGDFASLTGLTPRALRLYADAGVLVPAEVDPGTGYRSYDREQTERAERIRLLRSGGVAVPDLLAILDASPDEAAALLDAHLATIDGQHDRTVSSLRLVRARITTSPPGDPMSSTLIDRSALASAIDAASRCCASGPSADSVPALTGVRVRADCGGLHLVASDRYAAAFVDLACGWTTAADAERLVPPGFLTSAAEQWPSAVRVDLTAEGLVVNGDEVPTIPHPFPNIDPFLPYLDRLAGGCVVNTAELLRALPTTDGPGDAERLVALEVDAATSELVVTPRGRRSDVDDWGDAVRVRAEVRAQMETSWVSPSRLRSILNAVGDRATLGLARSEPVAIGAADDPGRRFLLMPMVPHDEDPSEAGDGVVSA